MIAGFVASMEGVRMGELEFTPFVFLIVGILHPATNTQPTIMKRGRSLIIFSGIRDFLCGV
jgi:hypothetical protein